MLPRFQKCQNCFATCTQISSFCYAIALRLRTYCLYHCHEVDGRVAICCSFHKDKYYCVQLALQHIPRHCRGMCICSRIACSCILLRDDSRLGKAAPNHAPALSFTCEHLCARLTTLTREITSYSRCNTMIVVNNVSYVIFFASRYTLFYCKKLGKY